MRGIAVTALFIIVFLLIIASLLIYITVTAQGTLEGGTIERILEGATIPFPLQSDILGTISFTDLTDDLDDTTSTEVACEIALKIKDDFAEFGYDEGRTLGGYQTIEFDEEGRKVIRTIIGSGMFQIKRKADGNFYDYADLSEEKKGALNNTCTGMGQGFPLSPYCMTAYLDEQCITTFLRDFDIGGKSICTKTGTISAGGELVKFGNRHCVAAGKGKLYDNADNNCEGTCYTDKTDFDDRIKWSAAGVTKGLGDIRYASVDRDLVLYDKEENKLSEKMPWPPAQCKEVYCEPGDQTYAWFLIWNKKEKKYEIVVPRVAALRDYTVIGKTDFSHHDLAVSLLGPLGYLTNEQPYRAYYRSLSPGYRKPELRMVNAIRAQPQSDISLGDFLATIENMLNSDDDGNLITEECGDLLCDPKNVLWKTEQQECSGDECYTYLSKEIKWQNIGYGDTTIIYDMSKKVKIGGDKDTIQNLKKFKILLDGDIKDQQMLYSTHIYKLVLNFWSYTFQSGKHKPSGVHGVCRQADGAVTVRNIYTECMAKGDEMSPLDSYYRDFYRIDGNSLIIIDEGEAPGQSAGQEQMAGEGEGQGGGEGEGQGIGQGT